MMGYRYSYNWLISAMNLQADEEPAVYSVQMFGGKSDPELGKSFATWISEDVSLVAE